MSEELQEILKRMKDFNYYGWLTKKETSILNNYIEQLQQENEELKEQNESLKKYYKYDNKSWKNLAIKQAHDLEIKNNILTEFEKWLVENYCLYIDEVSQNSQVKKIYDKLQELKEGKK